MAAPKTEEAVVINANSYVLARQILDELLPKQNIIKKAELWVNHRYYVTVEIHKQEKAS